MFLKNLSLINFKNFDTFDINLCDKVNCFIGDNGIGKTNILDSIHYLSFCKSFVNLSDRQNIKDDEDFFLINGDFSRCNIEEKISCAFQKDKKKSFKKNSAEYQKLSEHIGFLPVVYTTPYDSNLIHNGSDGRRKFVDTIISQFDKSYLQTLISYNHILEQRNQILKNYYKTRRLDIEELEIWDMQLVEFGEKIFKARNSFITDTRETFQKYYSLISNNMENVSLEYVSHLIKGNFAKELSASVDRDKFLGFTSVGVHKDDFDFLLGKNPIKRFGSQGQQKTFVISLKFTQFDYIKSKTNLAPILLLDDIFDKLDKKRVKMITGLVSDENFGQIFITDTSYSRMPNILNELDIKHKIVNLSNNKTVTNYE
ncbi:MAG: DNA replication and repair protein RecF [Bacteroidales bacterium]|nr:DNA replication and repair protein RecF [Bacteroidales bacterium]MDD4215824.1 DNA replication and repair protein RecF [Bacteroidales bacterium]MDY0141968.1 DNA replication and repair protein RecF [Bacteroidales bacterium]